MTAPSFLISSKLEHHRLMIGRLGLRVDAHRLQPRQPTFHLYDDEPELCCDYVFLTPDLVPRLRSIRIDSETQASDHQPVIVELA